jgi:hypothetical protein
MKLLQSKEVEKLGIDKIERLPRKDLRANSAARSLEE